MAYNEDFIVAVETIGTANIWTLYQYQIIAENEWFFSGTFVIMSDFKLSVFSHNFLHQLYLQFCLQSYLWQAAC
jgi:hypothetical protein